MKIKNKLEKNLSIAVAIIVWMTILGCFFCGYLYRRSKTVYTDVIDKFNVIENIEDRIQEIDIVMAKFATGIDVTEGDIAVLTSAQEKFQIIEKEIPNVLDVEDNASKDVYNRYNTEVSNYTNVIQAMVTYNPEDAKISMKTLYGNYLNATQRVKAFAGEAKEVIQKHKENKEKILTANSIAFPAISWILCFFNIFLFFVINKKLEKQRDQIIDGQIAVQTNREKAINISKMDIITQMPNRYQLDEKLKEINTPNFLVGIVKITNFEEIVLTFGHDFADNLRVDISERLRGEDGKFNNFRWFYINDDELCFVSESLSNNRFTFNISNELNKMWLVNNVNIRVTAAVQAQTFSRDTNSAYILQALETTVKNSNSGFVNSQAFQSAPFQPTQNGSRPMM